MAGPDCTATYTDYSLALRLQDVTTQGNPRCALSK